MKTQKLAKTDSLKNESNKTFDVIIVGAGVAGITSAIKFMQLAKKARRKLSVCIVEKGAKVGSHILSGAVIEVSALDELIENWRELDNPLDTPVSSDELLYLTKSKAFKLPVIGHMKNEGNYIISLGIFARWLAGIAEQMGVQIFTQTAAVEVLKRKQSKELKIIGIKTGQFGLDKKGRKTDRYVSGVSMFAKHTVFAEGCYGSLAKVLTKDFGLRKKCLNQTYAIGIKELWQAKPNKTLEGKVVHTLGWPLDRKTYGGSFLYHLKDGKVAVGLVVGLDYSNPYISPHMEFQRLKHHPQIAKYLKGATRISYGARAISEGGYGAIGKLTMNGGQLVGCAGGFLNVGKMKGIHTAMKSAMVGAEITFNEMFLKENNTTKNIILPHRKSKKWWHIKELHKVRNIRPAFNIFNLWGGIAYSAFTSFVSRGAEPWTFKIKNDYSQMESKDNYEKINYPKPDGVLSFDITSSVALSGTEHANIEPVHLILKNPKIAISVNLKKYHMPETRYCPAGVYELVKSASGYKLVINSQNCIHCKTCDIKDPSQNINWVCPQGGSGPNYEQM